MKLHFFEIPLYGGNELCQWLNERDLADYVLNMWPNVQLTITQVIIRVPDDFPPERLP